MFRSNFEKEIDHLIRLDDANRVEILTRLSILILFCTLGSIYFGVIFPIIWVIIYASASAAVNYAQSLLTSSRSYSDYVLVLTISFVQLICFRVMILYLWFYPHTAAHYLGIVMLLASMRFSVNLKARVPSYLFLHAIGDIAVIVILAVDFMLFHQDLEGFALVGLAFVCFVIYYAVTMRQNLAYLKEMRLLEERTRQSQKMEAVGRLTGGVAHDFNNILTVVLGNLDLHELLEDPKEKRQLLDQTRNAARRAAELTSQLLAFSRQSKLKQDIHCVAEVFEQVKLMANRLLPANIKLVDRVDIATPKIRVDKTQLEVALVNLIINARDAMPNGGTVDLTAQPRKERCNLFPLEDDVDLVSIALTDQGGGIPDDLIDKVTEPFFTTKPVGKGSGLGLSMVKGFAEQSDGCLFITTIPGVSTTVEICIPAANDPASLTDDLKTLSPPR